MRIQQVMQSAVRRCCAIQMARPILALFGALLFLPAARADLMLYPTRVVLERNDRAAQVELINSGSKPETYRINLVNRRMTEAGEIVEAKDTLPNEKTAEQLLRYSPRQVTLQPGVGQTVRILLRKPENLEVGEYRSHLQFDRVADADDRSSIEGVGKPNAEDVTVVLKPLVGASIPVIVRHGTTTANATLSYLAFVPAGANDKSPLLTFQINRTGNRSVYGDLLLQFTPKGGKPIDISKAAGIAVYVPNSVRKARMAVQPPEGTTLSSGQLTLTFKERSEAGGKLIAESSLTLP